MRPRMTVKKRQTDPDLSVRIPDDNYDDLQKIAKAVGIPLARLVVDLTFEIFGLLGIQKLMTDQESPVEPTQFVSPRLIRAMRANRRLREIALKIRKRDRRSLPMDKTLPTRIRFTKGERVYLAHVTARLHWAQSYVVWEAMYAALELATLELPLKEVPDIIKLYRGKSLYEATAQADALNTLTNLFSEHLPDLLGKDPLARIKNWLKVWGAVEIDPSTDSNDEAFDLIATFPVGPYDHFNVGILVIKNPAMTTLHRIDRDVRISRGKSLSRVWVIYFGTLSPELTNDLEAKLLESPIEVVFINGHELPQSGFPVHT